MATNNAVNSPLSGTTGTGNFVGSTSPTLTTPNIGTPSAGTLTNCTGLPVAGGGTGNSTFTAYSVLCAGTTATGAFQNVSGVGTSGQVLVSQGAGAIPAWADPAGGGGGKVLQVVSTTKTDTFTTASTSAVDITGLSASITPSSTSNKVLVTAQISMAADTTDMGSIKLIRGSTEIGSGAAAGSRTTAIGSYRHQQVNNQSCLVINYLDSPSSVASTTYKLQGLVDFGTMYINRGIDDSDNTSFARTSSTITLQEIDGT